MMKATQEHSEFSNLLNGEFKQNIPYKFLLMDTTIYFTGRAKNILQKVPLSILNTQTFKTCEEI
jgi:uncharacterized protein YpmS